MRQVSVLNAFSAVLFLSLLPIGAIAETNPGEEGAALAASLGISIPPIAPERGWTKVRGLLIALSSIGLCWWMGLGLPREDLFRS